MLLPHLMVRILCMWSSEKEAIYGLLACCVKTTMHAAAFVKV